MGNSALDLPDPDVSSEPETVAAQLERNPSLLGLRLQQLAERLGTRALLFVDQLEEVVTLAKDEEERSAFIRAVSRAAEDPSIPVRTIVTLREEFLSRIEASMGAQGGITQVTVLKNPDRSDLRRVLLQPVAHAQHRFEDESVVDEMVAEASRSSACLPLLQFGGAKLWEGRDRIQRVLRRATYAEMGGLAGALALHADQVLAALGPEDISTGRALCLRLVTPERTRRSVPRDTLVEGLGGVGAERFLSSVERPGVRAVGARSSLCVWDEDGSLSWFGREVATATAGWSDVRPSEVLAVVDGCVVREATKVRRFNATGTEEVWVDDEPVHALAWSPDGVWVATGQRLRRFGGGRKALTLTTPATALAVMGPWLAVGYASGQIELLRDSERRVLRLEKPVLESVARLEGGPDGTLIATYLNGAIRVWDTASGALLLAESLNGAIEHLHVSSAQLIAATDLGAFGRWSMASVRSPWCALLQQIWQEVPFSWQAGASVRRGPPDNHACRK